MTFWTFHEAFRVVHEGRALLVVALPVGRNRFKLSPRLQRYPPPPHCKQASIGSPAWRLNHPNHPKFSSVVPSGLALSNHQWAVRRNSWLF
ncbi:hypothetical protein LY78DRAFT_304512 [Colletotrichum sublineola]|nr:hypothetical protein LY78DRAFT_304512 [Colletotrichum sublineola]